MRRVDGIVVRRALQVLAVLLVAALAWFIHQAVTASVALNRASSYVVVLERQIAAGDVGSAQKSLTELQRLTERARTSSDGPLWSVASWVPILGKNAGALTTIASVLDEIADEAAPPIAAAAEQVNTDTFTPRDGKVDIATMAEIAPTLAKADEVFLRSRERLAEVDPQELMGRLRRPVGDLKLKIDRAQQVSHAASVTAQLAPQMLGADGKRSYLLLFQTNAEIRSLGGIPGSWAVIEADGGRVEMTKQGASADVRAFEREVVKLTDDELSVYSSQLGSDIRNTTFTPDFPRAAEIARELFDRRQDIRVDGVISVDPVALAHLLAGTGPVTVDGLELNAANAVALLLNQSYAVASAADQDAFFQRAARRVFDAVKDGQGQAQGVLHGLVRGASENRIMVWSADEAEQQEILDTGVSGRLVGDGGEVPHIGVYLNDATGTKLQYYLDFTTGVRATRCDDGVQTISTITTVGSSAPANAADLPVTLTGLSPWVKRGSMQITLRFYAPFGGEVTRVAVDGEEQTLYVAEHHGRPVQFISLVLAPGDRYQISTTMVTGPGQTADGVFTTTPGIAPVPNDVRIRSAC